jgi:hypothetical protein
MKEREDATLSTGDVLNPSFCDLLDNGKELVNGRGALKILYKKWNFFLFFFYGQNREHLDASS